MCIFYGTIENLECWVCKIDGIDDTESDVAVVVIVIRVVIENVNRSRCEPVWRGQQAKLAHSMKSEFMFCFKKFLDFLKKRFCLGDINHITGQEHALIFNTDF